MQTSADYLGIEHMQERTSVAAINYRWGLMRNAEPENVM